MVELSEAPPESSEGRAPEWSRDETRTWKDHFFKRRGWIVLAAVGAVVAAFVAIRGWPRPTLAQVGYAAPLVALGMAMRVWARSYLVRGTNTRRVHARRIIEAGPYRRVRNPIYVGNLAAAAGIALAFAGPIAAALVAVVIGAVYSVVVRSEEEVLHRTFPDRFGRLAAAVPRWFPRLRLRPAVLAPDADAPAPQPLVALRSEAQRILGMTAAWAAAFWLASSAP